VLVLQITLGVKIAVTLLCWAGPFLLLSSNALRRISGMAPEPILFARMLGVGWLALTVAYGWGFWQSLSDLVVPWVLIAGLVSNGGTALIMVFTGRPAGAVRWMYWVSVGLLLAITLGLAVGWRLAG